MYRLGSLVVLFGLLMGPVPAQAKGMELTGAVIRGPGLDDPLQLTREQFGIVRNSRSPAALAISLWESHPHSPPTGPLGPRFELTYRLSFGFHPDVRRATVRVDLYPYASVGPVTFTPPGQFTPMPIGRELQAVSSGWLDYPPELIGNFRRHGLPTAKALRAGRSDWTLLFAVILVLAGIRVLRRS